MKTLGSGAGAMQNLRELRDIRYHQDPNMGLSCRYIVALTKETAETVVFFPPGNGAFAELINANGCPVPDFSSGKFHIIYIEHDPIVPAYYHENFEGTQHGEK